MESSAPAIEIQVAFTPCAGPSTQPAVHVLIDVLRATSVIIPLFDAGARPLILVGKDEDAEAARRTYPAALLCSERPDGRVAAGADFAPSFADLEAHVVAGRPVVLRSTNGTVAALAVCARPGIALVGALLNASVVAEAAVDLGSRMGMRIRIVCAGREAASTFCLDDAYCAGVLVDRVVAAARGRGIEPRLRDSAVVARDLLDKYRDPHEAFVASESGIVLRRIGGDADIAAAARVDASTTVPVLVHGEHPRWLAVTSNAVPFLSAPEGMTQ
jgi:2-phosphosulfolactate phosphatase